MSKRSAYQLISAVGVVENVRHGAQTAPETERQTRPLTKLKEPSQQIAAWSKAVESSPTGKPTAKEVEAG